MEPMIRCNTCDQTDLHTLDKSKFEECYLLMWCVHVFYKFGTFFTSNKNIENVTIFRDSRTAESRKIRYTGMIAIAQTFCQQHLVLMVHTCR